MIFCSIVVESAPKLYIHVSAAQNDEIPTDSTEERLREARPREKCTERALCSLTRKITKEWYDWYGLIDILAIHLANLKATSSWYLSHSESFCIHAAPKGENNLNQQGSEDQHRARCHHTHPAL